MLNCNAHSVVSYVMMSNSVYFIIALCLLPLLYLIGYCMVTFVFIDKFPDPQLLPIKRTSPLHEHSGCQLHLATFFIFCITIITFLIFWVAGWVVGRIYSHKCWTCDNKIR
ncbi:hypothetical protein HOLleu_13514 [Holothuria leucospilota]|uniref:Uncharacterized protein n=1 Tax=Holothuria leucospilota TaxID=206669 RepID=A0A9Q1CBY0_HOLLE|nr:hypothetical protein HOLleu_13514 [Holothuria leucospilota]